MPEWLPNMSESDEDWRLRQPGARRFYDVLQRERSDMAWLVHVVAAMYDEVSGGAVSNPMTYPGEVVTQFEQRATNAYDEGRRDALADMAKAVRGISLPPGPGFAWVDGHMPFIEAVLAILDELA